MLAKRLLTLTLIALSVLVMVIIPSRSLSSALASGTLAPTPDATRDSRIAITVLNQCNDCARIGSALYRIYLSPDDKSYRRVDLGKITGLFVPGRPILPALLMESPDRPTGKFEFQSPDEKSRVSLDFKTGPSGITSVATIADGSGSNPISIGALTGAEFIPPAWSPDNKKIIFPELMAVEKTDKNDAMWQLKFHILSLDGSKPQEIVPDKPVILLTTPPNTTMDTYFLFLIFLQSVGRNLAFWTPDGQRIVAYGVLDPSSSKFPPEFPLVIMDADGKNVSYFLKDPLNSNIANASWSPDGSRLLFESSDIGGPWNIATSNANGSAFQVLFKGIGSMFHVPAWSPDGSQIAFISAENHSLWLMNADGTNPREFFSFANAGLTGDVVDLSWERLDSNLK